MSVLDGPRPVTHTSGKTVRVASDGLSTFYPKNPVLTSVHLVNLLTVLGVFLTILTLNFNIRTPTFLPYVSLLGNLCYIGTLSTK